MGKTLEKLGNYFLGLDIIEYYKTLKQKNPGEVKQLNQERNIYVIIGKVIPNILDVSGIIGLGLWELGPTLVGSTLIGGSEALRHAVQGFYEEGKMDHGYEEYKKAVGEVISTLVKLSKQQK